MTSAHVAKVQFWGISKRCSSGRRTYSLQNFTNTQIDWIYTNKWVVGFLIFSKRWTAFTKVLRNAQGCVGLEPPPSNQYPLGPGWPIPTGVRVANTHWGQGSQYHWNSSAFTSGGRNPSTAGTAWPIRCSCPGIHVSAWNQRDTGSDSLGAQQRLVDSGT